MNHRKKGRKEGWEDRGRQGRKKRKVKGGKKRLPEDSVIWIGTRVVPILPQNRGAKKKKLV